MPYDIGQLRGAFAAGKAAAENGGEYRPDPKRRAALERLKTDPLVIEAMQVEPGVKGILEDAKRQKNTPGYNRIRTYYDLKNQLLYLVGWKAQDRRLKTIQHWEAVTRVMADLLPEDDVDIYPDGKPE